VKRPLSLTPLVHFLVVGILAHASVAVDADAAQASRDGGQAGAPSVKADGVPTLPDALRSPVQAISDRLSSVAWTDWQVTADSPGRKQRLVWLAKDFGAPAFKRADHVDEAVLQPRATSGPPHVGLVVVHFAKCKQLAEARKRVLKAGRLNFALPVLTVFRMRRQGHSLTFVLSETPLRTEIEGLFESLDEILGKESACSD
jgi:hypothetical protein